MPLKLKIKPGITYSGVLDFNGSVHVTLDSDPSMTGIRTVTFNLWLDQDSGYSLNSLFALGDVGSDHLNARLNGSDLFFYTSSSSGGSTNRYVSISGLNNQILFIEVTKGTSSITEVKINGISQSLTNTVTSENNGPFSYIGRSLTGILDNATIWNIDVSGGSFWKGYPGGNLDSAWIDQEETNNGSVSESASTRDISGSGTGPILSLAKKMIIKPIQGSNVFDMTRKLLLSGSGTEIPYSALFQLIIDGSFWVDTGDSSVPYTGLYTPADSTWGTNGLPNRGVYIYNGKIYWPTGASSISEPSPSSVFIIDADTYQCECISPDIDSGLAKTISGDNFWHVSNCGWYTLSSEYHLMTTGYIGIARTFWHYDISTNTGKIFRGDSTPYSGYMVGDSYSGSDRTDLKIAVYDNINNAAWVHTTFTDYPAESAFLHYDYDTSTMRRLDASGFRDSSSDTGTQINGVPYSPQTLSAGELVFINEGGGYLLCSYDSSCWMLDISSNTGYIFNNDGLFNGSSTIPWSSGSILPAFSNSYDYIFENGYLTIGGISSVNKYDFSNNKWVGRIYFGTNPYFIDDTSTLRYFTGDTYYPGIFQNYWWDHQNNRAFIIFKGSTPFRLFMYDLDRIVITEVDSSTITNGNSFSLMSRVYPIRGSSSDRKLLIPGGSSTDLASRAIYQLEY